MKKSLQNLLPITFILSLMVQVGFAQVCPIAKDSIISGAGTSGYQLYSYDVQSRIVKVIRVDSGGTLANASYDTLIYGSNGKISKVETRDSGDNLYRELTITYNGSDRINTMVANDALSTWSMTHTVSYNGSVMTAIMLSNVIGQPDGFAASFTNMVYSGGNLTQVDLVGDLGAGLDTLELTIANDTKNNLESLLYISEAPDLLTIDNANNITTVTFDNQEIMGDTFPAGTIAIENVYTYNGDNNVATMEELSGVFNEETSTTRYFYDCDALSIDEYSDVAVDLYPNPFTNAIKVDLEELKGLAFDLVMVNILGVEVLNERYTNVSTVNLDGLGELNRGVYFVQIKLGDRTITKKLVKE